MQIAVKHNENGRKTWKQIGISSFSAIESSLLREIQILNKTFSWKEFYIRWMYIAVSDLMKENYV